MVPGTRMASGRGGPPLSWLRRNALRAGESCGARPSGWKPASLPSARSSAETIQPSESAFSK
jgi:hypothetical protein